MAQFRQPVLIYNPTAGKIRRNPEGLLQRTTAALARGGLAPRLLPTTAAGHADTLARQAISQGADLVLVLGGDGTINEAVQGLANTNVPMGVLPGGTANVLAMELGLGSEVARAAERLAGFEPASVALGRISQPGMTRYFVLMCGMGLDAEVITAVDHRFKADTGKLAYYAAAARRLGRRVEPLEARVNGSTYRCGYALASRVRNYGGDFKIAQHASLRRDDFEVLFFEGSHPLRYAWYMLGVLTGQIQNMRGVHTLRTAALEVATEAAVHIDGEFVGRDRFRIDVVPAALRLLMPPAYG